MSRRLLHRCLPAALALACSLAPAAEAKDGTTWLHACAGATAVPWLHPRSASLDDGRTLLTFDGAPALLSADRRELRTLDWPAEAGVIREIATLRGRGVLIAASHGLWLLDQAGTLRALTDCRDTGPVHASTRNARGQVLLRAEKGVFELTPAGALRQLTPRRVDGLLAVPDGRWLADDGGALLGLNDSGTLVPLLTGAKAARGESDKRDGWGLDSKAASDWIRLGRGWLIVLRETDAPLFVRDDGPVDRLRGPDVSPLRERVALIPLGHGRVFALLGSGLYRLLPGPVWRPVSTAVRLTCIDGEQGSSNLHLKADVPGRALFTIGQQAFEITPDDGAMLLHGQTACHQAGGFSAAAGADGQVYLAVDGGLFVIGPNHVLRALPLPAGAQAVADLGVRSVGLGRVVVVTKNMSYEVGPGGRLRPIGPVTSAVAMRGGRIVTCGEASNTLKQAVDGVHFEPVTAAAGRPCAWVEAALDGSALVLFRDSGPRMRIDADGRTTPLPGQRIELPDGDLFIGRESRPLFTDRASRTTGVDVPAGWSRPAAPTVHALQLAQPLHFLDARRGFGFFEAAVGERVTRSLAVSDDGGSTWRAVRSGVEPIDGVEAVDFADDGRSGMAVGSAGRVWATHDSGQSWQRLPDITPAGLMAVWMPGPAGRAYVLAAHDQLLRTDDAGKTWSPLTLPPHARIVLRFGGGAHYNDGPVSFSEHGRRLWWAGGDGHVLTSTDEGLTWTLQWRHSFADTSRLRGDRQGTRMPGVVPFEGPGARACLALHAGLLCSEPDSLALRLRSFPEQALEDLARSADGLHGWAVGADGLILATADGGATWTAQRSGVDQLLQHVFFLPDGRHGWASGEGVLLVTRDGGQTWERVLLPRVAE